MTVQLGCLNSKPMGFYRLNVGMTHAAPGLAHSSGACKCRAMHHAQGVIPTEYYSLNGLLRYAKGEDKPSTLHSCQEMPFPSWSGLPDGVSVLRMGRAMTLPPKWFRRLGRFGACQFQLFVGRSWRRDRGIRPSRGWSSPQGTASWRGGIVALASRWRMAACVPSVS